MDKIRGFIRRHAKALTAGVAAGVGVEAVATNAGAATISATFASTQTALVTELGYGVALVVALLLIGLGVRMLIKWSKKGVSAG